MREFSPDMMNEVRRWKLQHSSAWKWGFEVISDPCRWFLIGHEEEDEDDPGLSVQQEGILFDYQTGKVSKTPKNIQVPYDSISDL